MAVNHIWKRYERKGPYENRTRIEYVDNIAEEYEYWYTSRSGNNERDHKTTAIRVVSGNPIINHYDSYDSYSQKSLEQDLNRLKSDSNISDVNYITGYYIPYGHAVVGSPDKDLYSYAINYREKKYITEQVNVGYSKGAYISTVTSTSRNAYPDNSYSGSYWYVYQGIDNQAPIINSSITSLGDVKEDTSISFSVTDPDNDAVTVEINIDGIKTKDSPFVASRDKQYSIPITIAEYELGSHRVEVKATDSKGGTTTKTFTFSRSNINPVISGKDTDLGDKNLGFTVSFSIDDADLENTLTTTIKLNDKTLRTISNTARNKEYSINITDGELFALAMNELNTLTIKVDDGAGGESYRYYYFKRSNTAPTIETGSVELGEISEAPTIKFIAKDKEDDDLTYTVYLNDTVLVDNEPCERDKQLSYTIPKKEYSKLVNGLEHKIKLIVSDIHKATAIKTFTFKRKLDSCWHRTIKKTDGMKSLIHAYLNVQVADGAKLIVKVCNNGLDENPTWEDATENFTNGLAYKIKNTSKTAESWAVGIEVRIDSLKATEPSWILGYGGSYKA